MDGFIRRAAARTLPPVTVLALSACGVLGGGEPEPALGPVHVIHSFADYEDIALPFDAYELSTAQRATIVEAQYLLTRRCSHRFGFDIVYPPAEHPTRELLVGRRYGLISAQDAAQWGYQPPPRLKTSSKGDKSSGWNPTETEFVVANGKDPQTGEPRTGQIVNGQPVPEGGCGREAFLRLREGVPAPSGKNAADTSAAGEDDVQVLSVGTLGIAERDSRVQAALTKWRECMRSAGHDYRTVWEPNDRAWSPRGSPEEVATAVADVRCKQETNLLGIWFATEAAYQQREIDKHAEEFAAVKKGIDIQLRNAATVLGR